MALTYIEQLINDFPDSSDNLTRCKDLYQKRLWHQLTNELDKLILITLCKIDFVRFEANFIRDFRKYINTLRYGSIIIQIAARSYSENIINEIQGIAFCEQALSSIEDDEKKSQKEHFEDKKIDNTQTKLLIKTQIALFELNRNIQEKPEEKHDDDEYINTPFKIAKKKLDEIESEIESSIRACPPLIYSRYHYVASKLWQSQQNKNELPSDISWTAMFYKHAMSYLGYTALNQIDNTQKWANDIALAALVAPDFYDFGELSLHPIMKSLENTEQEWVLNIVNAYISADINQYNNMISLYSLKIKENNISEKVLNDKIRLLSLVRLAFDKASFERIISFQEIQNVTQCDLDSVEYLIMKAMSLSLIKGIVDEIDKTVNITYVKPSILDIKQMEAINAKIKVWIDKIQQTQKEIAPSINTLLQ